MYYQWNNKSLILNCRIQPKADKDCFAGTLDGCLKIRITAAPVDGKANRHLIKFLSRQFKAPQNSIEILSGENSRDKRISINAPGRLPPELNLAT